MKYILIILIIGCIILAIGNNLYKKYFLIDKDTCEKITNMTSIEIKEYLHVDDKYTLVIRIDELGECGKKSAIPELEFFNDDPRITHILKFKGLSIGKIATGAIKRIEDRYQAKKPSQGSDVEYQL